MKSYQPQPETCPCGKPLHYKDKIDEAAVKRLIKDMGALVKVTTPWGSWLVPRHYIALHGFKASELKGLAKAYNWQSVV